MGRTVEHSPVPSLEARQDERRRSERARATVGAQAAAAARGDRPSQPAPSPAAKEAGLRLFISYTSADGDAINTLVDGIEVLGHRVWVDRRLTGGQDWWDEILSQIRQCDAVLVAVSPALIESPAAAAERDYSRALGKPILPVIIKAVVVELLPPDLARLHFVDYSAPGPMAAFELAGALAALPAPRVLPEPLPTPPPVPISYLSDLSARVYATSLSLDEQLAVVARLRPALDRPTEREGARKLLLALERREDLFHAVARDVQALLEVTEDDEAYDDRSAPDDAGRMVPPGWYADPSGRHQLRWFDGDWTEWASDSGAVLEDPIS
ncbi:MAG TPA: TIR domain-containing protein [Acidimicrobiales bacterium]|nr:TIR domain-containing protein [Acidimicrobiales bacterium]